MGLTASSDRLNFAMKRFQMLEKARPNWPKLFAFWYMAKFCSRIGEAKGTNEITSSVFVFPPHTLNPEPESANNEVHVKIIALMSH